MATHKYSVLMSTECRYRVRDSAITSVWLELPSSVQVLKITTIHTNLDVYGCYSNYYKVNST